MDKKIKKKIDVLRERLKKLQVLLAAAKQQPDDLAELAQLERDIASTQAELAKLQAS